MRILCISYDLVMANKKVIIFDFDGTIADTFSTVVSILNGIAPDYGYDPLDIELISALRHKRAQDIIKIFRIPIWKIPKLLFTVKALLVKKLPELKPINGIPEMLVELKKQGFVVGIVSSNNVDLINEFLKRNSIEVFDFVYSEKDLFGKGKVLKNLLKTKGLFPEDVIYVGDETRDIEAARKAGLRIISVGWGFNAVEALERLLPDYLISHPSELLPIVQRI